MRTVPFDPNNPLWQEPPKPLLYVDYPSGSGSNGDVRPYNVDDEIAAWANPGPDGMEGGDGCKASGIVVPFPAQNEPPPNLGEQLPPARGKDGAAFLLEYEPISYTFDGVLPSGYLYGLTGRRGSGKTSKLIAATLAVITGRQDILGCEVERGRVFYVTKENPDDFRMKLALNCYFHGIDMGVLTDWDLLRKSLFVLDGRTDTPEQAREALRINAEELGPFQLGCYDTFQAGFASSGGTEFNDNADVLKFVLRLRPLTETLGKPSVLVAFHPTKNAGEEDLVPYGGGSIMNEIDGNLTLWAEGDLIKFHQNRVRGPEFEPRHFRIEKKSCDAILDNKGRQILLPVMVPATAQDAEEQEAATSENDVRLLQELLTTPKASYRALADSLTLSKSFVAKALNRLAKQKLIQKVLDSHLVTEKGKKAINSAG